MDQALTPSARRAHTESVAKTMRMNISRKMSASTSTAVCTMACNSLLRGPASQALSDFEDRLPEPEHLKREMKVLSTISADADFSCHARENKRRKSSIDMEDLLDSIKPVEDSITFPTIEWVFDDGDIEDEPGNASRSCCILDTEKFADGDEFTSWKRQHASLSHFGMSSHHAGLVRSKCSSISLSSGVVFASNQSVKSDYLKALQTSSLTKLALMGGYSSADAVASALAEAVQA